jgi:hypothetical protein
MIYNCSVPVSYLFRIILGKVVSDIQRIFIYVNRRLSILISLFLVGSIGLYLWWFYDGPFRLWLNYYVSSIFYEVFWCLVIFFFRPNKTYTTKIAIAVFAATCLLEFLQLCQAPFLEAFRRTFLGKALIGTDFVWQQFPYYVIGSFAGWLWLRLLAKNNTSSD